jgi:hypothetical protein
VNVAHDRLQLVNVCEKTFAAPFADAIDGRGTAGSPLLIRRYDSDFGERVKMSIQIAVGQIARALQLRKA